MQPHAWPLSLSPYRSPCRSPTTRAICSSSAAWAARFYRTAYLPAFPSVCPQTRCTATGPGQASSARRVGKQVPRCTALFAALPKNARQLLNTTASRIERQQLLHRMPAAVSGPPTAPCLEEALGCPPLRVGSSAPDSVGRAAGRASGARPPHRTCARKLGSPWSSSCWSRGRYLLAHS